MPKARIVPWKSKRSPDGSIPLYLVLHHRGQRSTLSIQISIKEKEWNASQREVRKTNRHHAKINRFIKQLLEKAEGAFIDAVTSGRDIDTKEIKELIASGGSQKPNDFLEDFARRIEAFRERGQHGSVDAYTPVLAKLTAYCESSLGKPRLPYRDLTVGFLSGFETYLIKVHGNGTNTVSKNLGYIRSVLYIQIREGRFPQDKNPFFNLSLRKKRAEKGKLTFEEVCALEDAELTGKTADVRNYFVFAFHAAGMRISDVLFLRGQDIEPEGDGYRLSYTMLKTGQVAYPMMLSPTAIRILRQYGWLNKAPDAYIFPEIPAGVSPSSEAGFKARKRVTAKINKLLKIAGQKAGIATPITTHMARHSWTYHLDRNNVPVQRISDTLSHGDIKTTQAYVKKVRSREVDDKLLGILKREER